MSATSGGSYDCQLCQNTYDNKVALTVHFCKHLTYKKYPCSSCRESFYTEDDRGSHCQKKNHDNNYTVISSPYCEMLTNMLLKDAKLLEIYDTNVIVAKRAKKNFEFEHELRDTEPRAKKELPRTPRKSSPPSTSSRGRPTPSPRSRKSSPAARKSRSPSKTRKEPIKGILKRTYSETASDTNETPPAAKESKRKRNPSQSAPETPKKAETPKETAFPLVKLPNGSDVKFPCGLCNKKVPSDYVSRKDHVSRKHMGTDHSDEDYVLVLEGQMKKAFLDLTDSDLECQICRKQFKSLGGRKEHVAKTHLLERLACPIDNCQFAGESMPVVNKHLKQSHNLEEGYKSMEVIADRKVFEAKYRRHNQQLLEIQKHCFPCPIPPFYQNSAAKKNTPRNLYESIMQDVSRVYQTTPMTRPLRRMSESSDSDEDSHRQDPAPEQQAVSPENADTDTAEFDEGAESPLVFASEDIKNIVPEPIPSEEQSQPETVVEEEDIYFVKERGKKKTKNSAVKEETVEETTQIQPPAEQPVQYSPQVPMDVSKPASPNCATPALSLSDINLQGSYSPHSPEIYRGALSDDQRDQYRRRFHDSRSPSRFSPALNRRWNGPPRDRRRGGGGYLSHERRNSENHGSYPRDKSAFRGSNSYGYRNGGNSGRYERERPRDSGDRYRGREQDRSLDDSRHYRNPSGQCPTYSILPVMRPLFEFNDEYNLQK